MSTLNSRRVIYSHHGALKEVQEQVCGACAMSRFVRGSLCLGMAWFLLDHHIFCIRVDTYERLRRRNRVHFPNKKITGNTGNNQNTGMSSNAKKKRNRLTDRIAPSLPVGNVLQDQVAELVRPLAEHEISRAAFQLSLVP